MEVDFFFLGRCLAEGLNSGRAVVLTNELASTHDILSPFMPWSNCSLEHSKRNPKNARVKLYFPMDSISLQKSPEMPGVGALYPKLFAEKGYWWWKSQEISYALRPKEETSTQFENILALYPPYASFQIRRTDKTQGCEAVYGRKSSLKCKKEASAPKLVDFITELKYFKQNKEIKYVKIVTDDVFIGAEIEKVSGELVILKPDPAPKRVMDKARKGGIYKKRSFKDAIDILTMARGDPFVFTYSSGFGALALQLKQSREDFCSNWVSLDWGKREWPPVGTASEGGVRGVRKNSPVVSGLCKVNTLGVESNASCNMYLKGSIREKGARIVNVCNCKASTVN